MRILSTNVVPEIRKDTGVFKVTMEDGFALADGVVPTLNLRRHGPKRTVGSFVYMGVDGNTLSFMPVDLQRGAYAAKLWIGACCCKAFDIVYEACPTIVRFDASKTETNCGEC